MEVLATGTSEDVVAEIGAWRNDYTGSDGRAERAAGAAGRGRRAHRRAVGAGARTTSRPDRHRRRSARCSRRVRDLSGLQVDLSTLDDQAQAYIQRVDEGIADRPDVVEAIREIESGTEPPLPSGEELASEIERFLRGQS